MGDELFLLALAVGGFSLALVLGELILRGLGWAVAKIGANLSGKVKAEPERRGQATRRNR